MFQIAIEINLEVPNSIKFVKLHDILKWSSLFEEDFVNVLVRNQSSTREKNSVKRKKKSMRKLGKKPQKENEGKKY